ncbi:MAG: CotH kinase family protein [Myxococcales bacterium]|nr:CotH kinase family protein [Myxococcales bacterium]
MDAMPPDGGVVVPAGSRVFDADVLHVVELTVAAADLPKLDDNNNLERVRATISLDGEVVTNAGLRKKGSTSRRPLSEKAGFTIKFNEFVPGQKLDGLKKLVLDNAAQDPSFLTGHISYEVYRRAGLPAPRTSHAVLRFNGVDKGIFVLEEATNEDYLKKHFGNGGGNLYEGPWDFPKGAAAADLKDEVSEGRTRDDLTALTAVVMNTPDAQFATQLAAHLDVERFIDNYAVEMVAALWDNYAFVAWNFYLYHVPNGRFVMLTHGINWPCCNISGAPNWKADLDPLNIHSDPWQAGPGFPPGRLCERIDAIPALAAQFSTALKRVARDAFDVPTLLARIDRAAATLHSRPLTGASAADLAGFDAEVGKVRTFVRNRKAYLTTRLGL